MADRGSSEVRIDRVENLSIVSLRIARNSLDRAAERLQLASALRVSGTDPRSLWLGPDRWLLVSDSTKPDSIIKSCNQVLTGILHNAVDYSSGLALLRVGGLGAWQLLATGTGVDLRPTKFPVGTCCRTRLAQIAAVIVAHAPESFDVYIDRSYETYLADWLAESTSISLSYSN